VRYYQYLKNEHTSTGPRREELLLRIARYFAKRTRDSKALNAAIAKLLGADLFCTREPYLAGEEVFSSQKRKADVLLGFKGESHRLNKVIFSCPQITTSPPELTMLLEVYSMRWKSSLLICKKTTYPIIKVRLGMQISSCDCYQGDNL
jgi:hypothetical protein